MAKLAVEKYLYCYALSHSLKSIIFRYPNVYGPRQRPDMAFHKFIKLILENKPIRIYGNGKQTRDFTYIDDICNGIILSAKTDNIEGEIFNLGYGKSIELNYVINLLQNYIGDFNIVHEEKKEGDVTHTFADTEKARKILGYKPKINIEKGLSKMVKWYKSEYIKGA